MRRMTPRPQHLDAQRTYGTALEKQQTLATRDALIQRPGVTPPTVPDNQPAGRSRHAGGHQEHRHARGRQALARPTFSEPPPASL